MMIEAMLDAKQAWQEPRSPLRGVTTPGHPTSPLPLADRLVAQLDERWRIIDDPLRWILQYWCGGRWRDRPLPDASWPDQMRE
jgi:hypothetical protein